MSKNEFRFSIHLKLHPFGVISSKSFGKHCYPNRFYNGATDLADDCLTVNFFIPSGNSAATGWPTIFLIHGGAFGFGTSSDLRLEAIVENYVSRGIIVITVNYRLGYNEFCSVGEGLQTNNVALDDLRQAFSFAIQASAGMGLDPKKYTLGGIEASAVIAEYLIHFPEITQNIKGLLLIGGSAFSPWASTPSIFNSSFEMARALNVSYKNDMEFLMAIQNLRKEAIFSYQEQNPMSKNSKHFIKFTPTFDKADFKNDDFLEAIKILPIPVFMITTSNEGAIRSMSDTQEDSSVPKEPPYGTDYAKSNRSSCKACKEPIPKDSLRMSLRTKSRFFDGLQDNWYHFNCFWKRAKVETLSEGNIKNLEQIKWDDQEKIRAKIAEIKEGGGGEEITTPKTQIPKAEIAKTSGGKCFDCKEKVKKGEVRIQYRASNFHPECLKKLAVLKKCAEEIEGFDQLNEEQKENLLELFGTVKKRKAEAGDAGTPAKKAKVEIDDDLKQKLKKQSETFWEVKKDIEKNLTREEIDEILQTNGRSRRKHGGPDAANEQLADCIIFGVPEKCPECEGGVLFYNGGSHCYECRGYISEYTRCTYTNKNPERNPIKIPKDVKNSNEFLKNHKFPTLPERYYAPGTDVINSIEEEDALQKLKKKRRAQVAETKSGKADFVKNGCSIDADCEVAEFSHVFIENANGSKIAWQATLGQTSLSEDKNSYYKLQLLEHDKKKDYYLFRSWGRIGSTQGGYKTEYFDDDLEGTKREFEKLFKEKSGNDWSMRYNFKKIHGKMDLLEMELDGKDSKMLTFDLEGSTSKLPKSVQKLIAMIFDVKAINDTLKALDLDTEKMPLGKLSVNHIKSAYSILTELQDEIEEGATKARILDASNRFYTMIPHVAGSSTLPLLDNMEIIRKKTKMMDELMDLEIAYKIINDEECDIEMDETGKVDPIDMHYKRLKCEIDVLDKTSKEYEIIQNYVKKTHAPTHSSYKLEITDVYEVKKDEEYKDFKNDIGNIHLLWHGSRTSNYAGILSQGLRIAPPEAPSNGYMFGKGVYFADMVSKSANYCHVDAGTKRDPNEGLLLLCEVALGEIQEEFKAKESIRKPKKGKSSVKGLGQIIPNEKEKQVLDDGVVVPMGKPKEKPGTKSDLLYNEYIVYDVKQIKMRYLVKAKFIY